jgi:hypothetical protein
MSSPDLVFDNSKEVFHLDKEAISFNLNIENISEEEPLKSELKSETELKITNLSDNYIVFRTKTTKKLYYSVTPTYCIIPPKEIKNIKIALWIKEGEIPKLHGHKFKFEAFSIDENEKDKEPKELISEYIQKGIPVTGNSQKTFVQFNEGENSSEKKEKNEKLLSLPKISHIRSGSNLSDYQEIEEKKENESESKPLLSEQIKSNEEQKPSLSDMITGEKIESGEIKNEVKEENINTKKDEDNTSVNENKNECCKINRNIFEDERKDVPDVLIFFALFIAMLSGYYLVK